MNANLGKGCWSVPSRYLLHSNFTRPPFSSQDGVRFWTSIIKKLYQQITDCCQVAVLFDAGMTLLVNAAAGRLRVPWGFACTG